MKSSCRSKMHKPFVNSVPRRSVVSKRWTMLLVILAVTALFAMVGTTIAAQKEATRRAQDNVAVGEPEVKKMLPLMDQENEGKLEVKKLTQPPAQPVRGFHK